MQDNNFAGGQDALIPSKKKKKDRYNSIKLFPSPEKSQRYIVRERVIYLDKEPLPKGE